MGIALDYLTRDKKTGRLSYRRLYPLALRPFIPAPSTELKVSLAATRLEAPGAIDKFRNAAAQYDATVTIARKASKGTYDALTPELATFLIAAYRAEELALDEEVRWLDRPLAVKTRAALNSRQIIEGELAECRALRALGDIAAIVQQWSLGASDYADTHELRLDQTTPAFALYCRAFNDVNIEVWEAVEQRLDGRSIATPPMPPAPSQTDTPAPPTNNAETFEAIAEAQLTNVRTPASATTLQASRTALRFLREALGPVTPAALTRKAVSEWLDLSLKSARRLLFPCFGEWWSLYVRQQAALATGGGRQPSREFRHTWTTAARTSGIPRDAREYLQGHSAANGTANEGYGEFESLGLAIDKLTFAGLDLSGVKRWTPPEA